MFIIHDNFGLSYFEFAQFILTKVFKAAFPIPTSRPSNLQNVRVFFLALLTNNSYSSIIFLMAERT